MPGMFPAALSRLPRQENLLERAWIIFFFPPQTRRRLIVSGDLTIKEGKECENFSCWVSEKQSVLKFLKSSRGIVSSLHCEAHLEVRARNNSPVMNTDCSLWRAEWSSSKLPAVWHVCLSHLIFALFTAAVSWCVSADIDPILILKSCHAHYFRDLPFQCSTLLIIVQVISEKCRCCFVKLELIHQTFVRTNWMKTKNAGSALY